jgi:putative aldouronate transport system substrate-binding protein
VDEPLTGPATNRRNFLAIVGLGAAALASGGLLEACSKPAGNNGNVTNVSGVDALLPKYQALDLVKPDIPGIPPVGNGFLHYPSNPVQGITTKPGTGGATIKAMTPWWGPTPPGLGNNSYLDAIDDALNAKIDFLVQDGNTYGDKLQAILAAKDVPDLLCIPSWEYPKIARFSDAVKALFEDLSDYLKGDNINNYKMLATLPTNAWRNAFWNNRLYAVPWPTDGPFPWALFYRKDLTDAAGLKIPTSAQELYDFGKAATNPSKGVWAFNDIFAMVQVFHGVAGSQGGWRKGSDGKLLFKYEQPEYKAAVEFMAKVYADGLVHPDIVASKGADSKTLFSGGKIVAYQDGIGAWRGMYRDQLKVTPTFNMQPMPIFAANGGTPNMWGSDTPIFYTFIKKGLGKDRTQELLRILDWDAAPLGTKEYELAANGVEGKHFTRAADGTPVATPLGQKEIANQYGFLGGRVPAIIGGSDVPHFVEDLMAWSNQTVKYLEKDPWVGLKLEPPANYAKIGQPTEDKVTDILRGRRPLSDLDTVISEWKTGGGDEGRDFFAKALSDNGR